MWFPGPLQGPDPWPLPKGATGKPGWSREAPSHFLCPVIIRFADKWGLLINGIKHVLPRVITVIVNQT